MKRKKKLIIILVCIAVLCAVLFFACRSENGLFKTASPTTSALRFVWFDGSSGSTAWLFDAAREQQIITELSKVKATPAVGWTPDKVTFPIYGLSIGGFNADGVEAAWSNGYLIVADGSVYEFDYDFSRLKESYEWEDVEEISHMGAIPCQRYLAQNGDVWMAQHLTPAEEKTPPENITMELVSAADDIVTVTLTNSGTAEWAYGEHFSLEVLLDGLWYRVPYLPTPQNWGFNDIAYILPAGETSEETYGLSFYGDLPSGTYRLVVEGLTAEFEV